MSGDVSEQWRKLTRDEFGRIDGTFLDNFRAPSSRNKFVAWDPTEQSNRYFKFLLQTVAKRQSDRFFSAYKQIRNRNVGRPLSVRCNACDIDADYLAAVEEWEFLQVNGALDGVDRVVEIGAGFGRTCHTLLTLHPSIREYVIVDLPAMLELSRAYLARVVPDAPVTFVSSEDGTAIENLQPSLAINIDSFQEMPPPVIASYMTRIVQRARAFYCKNPVGKYLPAAIGRPDLTADQMMDVMKLGRCREVIEIFDTESLAAAHDVYVQAYQPRDADGNAYEVVATKEMDLFPYFVHALYRRSSP